MEGSINGSSDIQKVELIITKVSKNKTKWKGLAYGSKLAYLKSIQSNLERYAKEFTDTQTKSRGAVPGGPTFNVEGAAWVTGTIYLGTAVHTLIDTYSLLAKNGSYPRATKERQRFDGQVIKTVFPRCARDKMLYPEFRAEIWLEKGAKGSQGYIYEKSKGGCCAVFGAGNYEAPIDVMTKMFVENKVVIFKQNPVNELVGAVLKKIFKDLIEDGYLHILAGGSDVGKKILSHPDITDAVLTGGKGTYNRIVWGATSEEQERNRKSNHKVFNKRLDAELGGVTPMIIVPGKWTQKEIDHQASQISATKHANGGHACISPQVVIVDDDWPQKDLFLNRLRHHLAEAPTEVCYYPGAMKTYEKFRMNYPQAQILGQKKKYFEKQLNPLFIPEVEDDSLALKEEAFTMVLAQTSIKGTGGDSLEFLNKAVQFCNEKVFGDLACSVIVDPRTARRIGSGIDDCIAKLEYGIIGVNVWSGFVAIFPQLTWGAFPGNTAWNIESGVGQLGNSYMFDQIEKSVLWTPMVSSIHLQNTRPRDLKTVQRMAYYAIKPSWMRLLKLWGTAIFGI
ncbi:MAG: aldehyde dehydrogenase family protein [Desulfobacteraceae bacterium]|jgi:acyl-CoA reductase-like NAD-dependent aldehyde dehydrogenase